MPPRTNACATCRKKRIKCDATLPECLMCIKFNRRCPGPTSGPVVIEMKPKAKPTPRVQLSEYSPALLRETVGQIPKQISARNVQHEFFYSTFLACFTVDGEAEDIQNKQTWLSQLPSFSTDGTNPALELAVQAAASAFASLKTQNVPLLRDACALYGRALHLHSRVLGLQKPVTIHMVSTTVLLSIFETIHATSAVAYCAHIQGAARMVEAAGPEACMRGVLCQIYYHIRTQLLFVYLTCRAHRQTPESAENTLRETLRYEKLPVLQRLLTLVSRLCEIYVRLEDGNEQTFAQQLNDADVFVETRSALEALEQEYRGEKVARTRKTAYRNPYAAVCIAYFATARLLLSVVAPQLPVVHVETKDHSQDIVAAAAYLYAQRVECAFMRMSVPLFLVALHAPRPDQRTMAVAIFEEWIVSGLGGISALALMRIHERGIVSACP